MLSKNYEVVDKLAIVQIIDASNAAGPVVYGSVTTNTNPEKIAWVPFTVPVVDTTILGAL